MLFDQERDKTTKETETKFFYSDLISYYVLLVCLCSDDESFDELE